VSVQFGRWNIDGQPADRDYLAKAGEMLAPYGPDGGDAYIKDNVGILYRAFHTNKESRKESQPLVTPSGEVLCWDGRLDNREELLRELRGAVPVDSTDLAIVSAAYGKWGTNCFAKLIGDWALSICDPVNHSLVLAKDPIGIRHLYYCSGPKQITWSTILDPLVLLAEKTFTLEEEYIAGWLSFFPATHLTPYVGIYSVPPASFVRLRHGQQTVSRYWDFDPSKQIRYRTDGEYEDHFRHAFREAVRRRLRSDRPILAELSGGMDSSSIVCMADTFIARDPAESPRLDTISYYADSEPNWNERPYFTKVEEKRGRIGWHLDVGKQESFNLELHNHDLAATPGSCYGRHSEINRQFAVCMASQGNRVVLSGIGGDEITGGIPTPIPELADLLARAKLGQLAHRLKVWALIKRKPWPHLLMEAVREFIPPALFRVPKFGDPAPWLSKDFAKRYRVALRGYEVRTNILGSLPSFQVNLATLEVLRRQLACEPITSSPLHFKCYPYLDSGLLEFIYSIPREQLVRPGERRSLMRRALVGIVPEEILTRKRKAFVSRAPSVALTREWASVAEITRDMVCGSLGIVDTRALLNILQKARQGQVVAIVPLLRSLIVERWLEHVICRKLVHLNAARLRSAHGLNEQMPCSFKTRPEEIQPK
jgi:asparagine synthase (glutamine-hydrolysing)